MDMTEYLRFAAEKEASDLFIVAVTAYVNNNM